MTEILDGDNQYDRAAKIIDKVSKFANVVSDFTSKYKAEKSDIFAGHDIFYTAL